MLSLYYYPKGKKKKKYLYIYFDTQYYGSFISGVFILWDVNCFNCIAKKNYLYINVIIILKLSYKIFIFFTLYI